MQGFGVEFAKHQYGVGQSLATLLVLALGVGGLIGVNVGGRLADRLRKHGRSAARVEVGGLAMAVTGLFVLPMLFLTTVASGLVPLVLTGVCQGATNPPLDAARLDVMPPAVWGQAEGIRSVAKSAAQALSPVLFGFMASDLFGGSTGLRNAFAVMLLPLVVAGLIVAFAGRRTYPGDEAAAEAARPSS